MRVLLVEDHLSIARLIKQQLNPKYVVDLSSKGKKALELLSYNDYSLIILDVGLPDMSGFNLCREIRQFNSQVPILMLTGYSDVEDRVKGFDIGADDYLLKPFEMDELKARISALLRRTKHSSIINLKHGNLVYSLGEKAVYYEGKAVNLKRKELMIVELLLRRKGQVITRELLLNHVWNKTDAINNVIEVHISNLRKKLDKAFGVKIIKTIHGLGYKIG